MKKLNLEINFGSIDELSNDISVILKLIRYGYRELDKIHYHFDIIDVPEPRHEIINGQNCVIYKSKME